jgi:hypothetical protein
MLTDVIIQRAIETARKHNWTPLQLGRELTGPHSTLTPPEATLVMDKYRQQYPNAGAKPLPATPKLPSRKAKRPAGSALAVTAEGGELLTTPNSATAGRPSIINRSAVKAYALKVSKERRAGLFQRVSKEFLDSVEANLEALIREIAQGYTSRERVVPDPEADWMINGRTLRCAEDKLNEAVERIVLAKVHGHPSIGKTLK